MAPVAARADSTAVTAPHIVSTTAATTVTLGGSTFVNQGLVGTIRLPADLHDFNGETLGSFSGMAIDLSTWRRGANGAYTGSLYTLPDRGPNNIGGFTTTNYAGRLNKFTINLTPYDGAAPLASNVQQGTLTQSGGFLFRDTTGQLFTGRDPLTNVIVRDGISYPSPPAGDVGAGKIALDAEAVSFLNDGSFYIGDEYGAAIYYFGADGKQIGAIQANPDLLPRVNGAINFNGTNDSPLVAGSTGRRSNQGMEGVSVSPDGTRLFAVLQSATLQDNPTNVAVRRNNTRILVYDISASKTPTAPLAEYVLQLPVYNNSATGTGAASATAAQSEVLALNNSQFLVLSRDGNGRGTNGNANAIAFKSVLLVDLAGATNIAGTSYSTGMTPISTTAAANGSGALVGGIAPVQQVELVNMLDTGQLSRFGVNLKTNPSTQYTLSEKWEALGLAPTLEEAKPQDFFLLIGNDNDFVSADIDAAGVTDANAALNSPTAGVGNNDNVVMVYRLTLPTYIDPRALAALKGAAPYAVAGARTVGARIGAGAAVAAQQTLGSVRRAYQSGQALTGLRAWGQGGYDRIGGPGLANAINAGSLAAGLETGKGDLRYGFAVSGTELDGDRTDAFDVDGHAYGAGAYVGLFDASGFYAQGAVSLSKLKLKTRRPAAYGLFASGQTSGHSLSADVQFGYSAKLGSFRVGPFVDVLHARVDLDGYDEHGAAVGNGRIADSDYSRTESTIGIEAALAKAGAFRPSLRVGYTKVDEGGDSSIALALAAVPGSLTSVVAPKSKDGFVSAEAAVEGEVAGFGWRASAGLRDTEGKASTQFALQIAKSF